MDQPTPQARDPRIPLLSILFGFGPALLLPLLAAAAWALPAYAFWAVGLAQLWGSAILIFLAGVRRGLSFFTGGGERPVQIATMIWLFLLGLAGLALPPQLAFAAQLVGYA